MLIVPVQDRINWHRPPLLTLALIVLNTLIFFVTSHQDQVRMQQLDRQVDSALLARHEAPLVRAYLLETEGDDWQADELSRLDPDALHAMVIMDLAFDRYVADHWRDTPPSRRWQTEREDLQAWREQISWVRWGFKAGAPEVSDALASMFLHADIFHLLGNMLFLLLFGLPLERHWGTLRLLPIYLLAGTGACLIEMLVRPDNLVPGIGASGAIAGLMGSYAATYGWRRIEFFASVGFWFGSFRAPALLMFPVWLGYELIQNATSDSNVNYLVHAGGLIAGLSVTLLWKLFSDRTTDQAPVDTRPADRPARSVPAQIRDKLEALRYTEAMALCKQHLSRDPGDREVWFLRLDCAAAQGQAALLAAAQELLAQLKTPPYPDALVASVLSVFDELQGDRQALAPPYRLLEAEMLARLQETEQARTLARHIHKTWQHPRLERLLAQLGH